MRTKIIATVGPSTFPVIKEVFKTASVARFNFSHRNYAFFKKVIKEIRKHYEGIPILADLKGPEIRTRDVKTHEIKKGDVYVIGKDFDISYEDLAYYVNKGDIIKIDDGKVELQVLKTDDKKIEVVGLSEGKLEENKSVNIPGRDIDMPALTEQDYEDLDFIKKHDFDYIAQSFVKHGEDVRMLKEYLDKYEALIIAKIEHQRAIKNLPRILKESEGVMVARGDLGVETDIAYLPIYQKQIIEKARNEGKIVVVATHLLRSMVKDPLPSRAEITDIYYAVSNKPDALMLSEETAIGYNPVRAVNYMKHVIEVAENYYFGEEKKPLKLPDMDIQNLIKLISSLEIPRSIKWNTSSLKKKRWGKLLRGVL
ncbi:MAG: pyruvate kinase [Candidatus Nanohaloarchaeota archaeon]|nr:pyruvate kinase [Candidatus Nanohaloarchaeota archaeon]